MEFELPLNLSTHIAFGIFIVIVFIALYTTKKKQDGDVINPLKPRHSGTPFLDTYTTDFTELVQKDIDPIIGRKNEVRKLTQILSRRRKNNALLVGAPGVGKTAVVEALAQHIVSGDVPEHLKGKRLLSLDIAVLMSGTKYRGEFEKRAKKIVQEIANSHRSIILFIDEIHSVIQSQGTEGAINFSDILKPALARGDLQMIGATTTKEYEQYIKNDPSLERRFQPVEIDEPSEEEALKILQGIKDAYREYHKVEFTTSAIKAAVHLSKKLVTHRKLPDKAIDALDEAAAMKRISQVTRVNSAVPSMLYHAAVKKYPEVAHTWEQVQKIDEEDYREASDELEKKREKLENALASKGIVTVDADDIEKVITEWLD